MKLASSLKSHQQSAATMGGIFHCRGCHGCSSCRVQPPPQLDGSGVQFHRYLHKRGIPRDVDIVSAALGAGLNEGVTVRQERPRFQQDHVGAAAHRLERQSVGGGGDNRLEIGPLQRCGARQDRRRTGGGGGHWRGCEQLQSLRKGTSHALAAPHSPPAIVMGGKGVEVAEDEDNFVVGG